MADAMDDSSSVPYMFITLVGTGMPWSEQEEGLTSFLEWARSRRILLDGVHDCRTYARRRQRFGEAAIRLLPRAPARPEACPLRQFVFAER